MRNGIYINKTSASRGFTIVEMITIISVLAVLASIVVIGYNSWRQTVATSQVKSDLTGVASAMASSLNFHNSYVSDISDLTSVKPSTGVVFSGGSVDGGKTFCVNAYNQQYPGATYHVDSVNGINVQSGSCPTTYTADFRLLLRGSHTGKVVVVDGLNSRECIKGTTSEPFRCDYTYGYTDSGKTLTSVTAVPDNPADLASLQWRDCWENLITSSPSMGVGNFTNIVDTTYEVNFGPQTWVSGTNCWTLGY
jgi:Tfp pilus assembly protein PilE